jgi:D-alanyl-D-alanine carboxypeptidase/D-alanyl-D-alanine-endopeptidase (penicillin-binding protein 4)
MPRPRHLSRGRLGAAAVACVLALLPVTMVTNSATAVGARSADKVAAQAARHAELAATALVPVTGPLPTSAGVIRQLQGPASSPALGVLGFRVVDLATGQVLADLRGQQPAKPASSVKLLVATAALRLLGPGHRLETQLWRAPSGDFVLRGGGDVTLTRGPGVGYPAAARIDDLAAKAATGSQAGAPRLLVDASLFSGPPLADGLSSSDVSQGYVAPVSALAVDEGRPAASYLTQSRSPDPAIAAGEAMRSALVARGVPVGPIVTGTVPPGSQLVASVSSAPVSALIARMLLYSDNDLAEALGHLVALAAGQPATFAGGVTAVRQVLTGLGVPLDGVVLRDASGLSPNDRVPPAVLTDLLVTGSAADHPELRPVLAGLPVAGLLGTLAGRFHDSHSAAGAGVVRAKTGTLGGVGALAGVVVDADGRSLGFAALATPAGRDPGERALDALAAALAQCGCQS